MVANNEAQLHCLVGTTLLNPYSLLPLVLVLFSIKICFALTLWISGFLSLAWKFPRHWGPSQCSAQDQRSRRTRLFPQLFSFRWPSFSDHPSSDVPPDHSNPRGHSLHLLSMQHPAGDSRLLGHGQLLALFRVAPVHLESLASSFSDILPINLV